jgi:hypothetical protein
MRTGAVRSKFRIIMQIIAVSTRLAAAATVLFATIAGSVAQERSEKPVAVVEFFTSQGCSSCPPADAIVSELAAADGIIALAYHVDYWDYLGWSDTLGSAENSARQYEYVAALGQRAVYTPQAIVNGRAHVNGADRAALDAALTEAEGALEVDVTLQRQGDAVVIETGAAADVAPRREAHVMLVYFTHAVDVAITKGENRGRTITYENAVTAFHSAGVWHGKAARFEMPVSEVVKKGDGGCAAIIQEVAEGGRPGAILGAAILNWDGDG